jgi:hypothetical protein
VYDDGFVTALGTAVGLALGEVLNVVHLGLEVVDDDGWTKRSETAR